MATKPLTGMPMVDPLPLSRIEQTLQRPLTSLERLVLESSWQGQRYRKMADDSGYAEEYVKQVGARLWAELSEKSGSTVTKKNLRLVFDQCDQNPQAAENILSLRPNSRALQSPQVNVNSPTALELPLQSPAFSFDFPSGPLPLASSLYIPRPPLEESAFGEIIRPGGLLCIKAPRRFGKTSLLQRVIHYGTAQGYRTCRIDLLEADDQVFDSIDTLLQWFCRRMAYDLELDMSVNDLWDADLGSKVNGGIFLQQVLAQAEPPLMLTINALEQVFCHDAVARDFLSLLRFWHERSKDSGPWQRLRLVLVYGTDSYVTLNLEASPFNVGHSIRLPPFTLAQFVELGRRYRLTHMADPGQRFSLEALYRLIAGHPYLANLSFYTLAQGQRTLPEILNTATGSDSIFRSHLQEMGAQLRQNPTVLAAWQQVIEGQGVALNAVDAMGLESLGLIRTQQGLAYPLCNLYQRFFAIQLKSMPENTM